MSASTVEAAADLTHHPSVALAVRLSPVDPAWSKQTPRIALRRDIDEPASHPSNTSALAKAASSGSISTSALGQSSTFTSSTYGSSPEKKVASTR
jgi:hypothetical protein